MTLMINQHDFTHGELGPVMFARSDLEIYRKAAQTLRNVIVLPQGAAKRRFGLEYIDEISANSNEYLLANFEYSEIKSYLLVFTNLSLDIYLNDVNVATVVTPWPASVLIANTLNFAQRSNSMVFVNEDYQPQELKRGTDDATWTLTPIDFKFFPTNDFEEINYEGFTFSLSAVTIGDDRTLTCSDDIFSNIYVGGVFEGFGKEDVSKFGVARITEFTDSKNVKVNIIATFDTTLTSGVKGKNVYLGEPSWSDTRFWPISVTFYESRLVFGGSKSLSQTLFFSVENEPFNFDQGIGLDNEAIIASIATKGLDKIQYVLGDKNLQVFTLHSEFVTVQTEGRSLTPTDRSIRQQTNVGVRRVPPVAIDNQTIYVKKGGKAVMSFGYNSDFGAYISIDNSLISSHIINNPIDMDIRSSVLNEDADYVFVINSGGTLAVYQSIFFQKVSAWTLSETTNACQGKFKRVSRVGDETYFIVERAVNGSYKQYIEKLNFNVYTDSTSVQAFGSPISVISGLDHLEGLEVQIRGDGYVFDSKTVSGGSITLSSPVSEVEVGLQYIPRIKPMPLAPVLQSGHIMYKQKRISNVYVDYVDSLGVYIDSTLIPFNNFNGYFPYPAPEPETGFYEYTNLDSWDARQMIEITQRDPLPMTIIGIGFELEG